MKTTKKIISSAKSPSPSDSVPEKISLIPTLQHLILQLFDTGSSDPRQNPLLQIRLEASAHFVENISRLADELIENHLILFSRLETEHAHIFQEYMAQTEKIRSESTGTTSTDEPSAHGPKSASNQETMAAKLQEAEEMHEKAYDDDIRPYEESFGFEALSTVYYVVLSLKNLALSNYWADGDTTKLITACQNVLTRLQPQLLTHHHEFHKMFSQQTEHPSELAASDYGPSDTASAVGVATLSSEYHPNENQDIALCACGLTVVADGVSIPPSHNAPRTVGEYIRAHIEAAFPHFLTETKANPLTPEGTLQIINFIHQIIVASRAAIPSTSEEEATTLALNVIIKVTKPDKKIEYSLFALHVGDSETVIYDPKTQDTYPLNPLLQQKELRPDFFPTVLPSGARASIWLTPNILERFKIPMERNPNDPGCCITAYEEPPCLATIAMLRPEDLLITFTDGLKDNFNHVRFPIQAYPLITAALHHFVSHGATNSQMAHGLAALCKLHTALCFSDPTVAGKEDDVTVVIRSVEKPAGCPENESYFEITLTAEPATAPPNHDTKPRRQHGRSGSM